MNHKKFAQNLGFSSYEALVRASEPVIKEGDVNWYVTQLPDGRWASWKDADLSIDMIMHFFTRGEAIAFHLGAFAEKMRIITY